MGPWVLINARWYKSALCVKGAIKAHLRHIVTTKTIVMANDLVHVGIGPKIYSLQTDLLAFQIAS